MDVVLLEMVVGYVHAYSFVHGWVIVSADVGKTMTRGYTAMTRKRPGRRTTEDKRDSPLKFRR